MPDSPSSSAPSGEDSYMFKRNHRSMARIYPIALSAEWQRKGLTSLHVDGFDISSAQFPPEAWMPETVRLRVQDAFQPFPPDKCGVYDVVHVRYFSTLVKEHSLQPLIRNLVGLLSMFEFQTPPPHTTIPRLETRKLTPMVVLEPGGYLQWSEPDMSSTKATATSPSTLKGAAEKLSALMRSPRPGVEVK
ncbi:MAG: hypothetical protein Q9207_008033 [Kuettlingeria erythrocarpa]